MLDGITFMKQVLFNSEQEKNISLNAMCLNVLNKNGKPISKQGLNDRFSEKSIAFMKRVIEVYLLKMNKSLNLVTRESWMDLFIRVLVKDGTRFDIPELLAKYFKGFGGSFTSDAGMCIQFEYDLKNGQIVELKTTSANIPDSKDAQLTKDDIQKGDLILRDLGYFGLNILREIIEKEADFISKLNTQVCVYEKIKDEFQKLDFVKLQRKFHKTGCSCLDLEVYIGQKEKIPVRLIVEKIPENVYEQRIQTATKISQKKGYKMSNEYAARQRFNCYVTSISKEKLKAISIRQIYRLRWQIELVFKVWKSTYTIDKIQEMKYERWMTLFYARLFLMLIHWQLYNLVKISKYKVENKLLSMLKSMRTLQRISSEITKIVNKGKEEIKVLVEYLTQLLSSNHDQEKKKGRKNQEEIIDIIYCLSVN